jgi:cbb3-type cytochrome oxidase subunit 3
MTISIHRTSINGILLFSYSVLYSVYGRQFDAVHYYAYIPKNKPTYQY